MSKRFRFAVLLTVVLFCAASAFAASQNAVLYGTVYDASAKPMGGVKVALENPAIGFSRTTMTASDGSYSFSEVPPASGYKLTATGADGKALDIRGGITVAVGEESVIAPPLKAQAQAEVVVKQVEAGVTTEKVSATQSGVITGEQLRSLPLYNRNFLTLGTLAPNTHDLSADDPIRSGSFSIAGNRGTNNSFLLDGGDNLASSSNQAVPFQVNDAIQEFSVLSSAAGAEYGHSGGVVNVATRRGSNAFHGSVFGYFGTDDLNGDKPLSVYNGTTFDKAAAWANDPAGVTSPCAAPFDFGNCTLLPIYYNDYVATAGAFGYATDGNLISATPFDPAAILALRDNRKQPWDQRQWGGNAGGALIKDKLFYFGSYEGTSINNPNPIFERVPTQFDKNFDPYGDGVTFASGNGQYDANFVFAQRILQLYPQPNVVAIPNVFEFYQGYAPNYTNVHNFLGRMDWVATQDDTFSLRYVVQLLDQLHDSSLPQGNLYPGNGAFRDSFNHNLNVGFTHVFTPNVINEAHVGFSRFAVSEDPQDGSFPVTGGILQQNLLPTFLLGGIDPRYSGAGPGFYGAVAGWNDWLVNVPLAPTMDGLYPYARLGAPLYAPGRTKDWTWFLSNSLSWTRGAHQFKFGGEYRHFSNYVYNGGYNRGYIYTGNLGAFIADSQNSSPFLWPTFDLAHKAYTPYEVDLGSQALSLFAQDTWRVTDRVTLTLGVRWEYFSRPSDSNNNLWNFDPTANGLVQAGTTTPIDQFGTLCAGLSTVQPFNIDPGGLASLNLWDCATTGSYGINDSDYSNFSPRVGLAWDIFGSGKTIFRAGGGLYYDREPTSYTAQLMYNRPTAMFMPSAPVSGAVPQATYGSFVNIFGWGNNTLNAADMITFGSPALQSAVLPFALYGRDASNYDTPRTWNVNATLQHQFNSFLIGEVGYIGTFADNLPVVYNQGFDNEWFCNASSFSGSCDNNSFSPVFMMTNRADSSYHSLLVRARSNGWKGLRVNAQYMWSRAEDNASNAIYPTVPLTLFNYSCGPDFWVRNSPVSCSGFPSFGATAGLANLGNALSAVSTTGAGAALNTPYLLPQDPHNFLRDDRGPSDYNSTHRFVTDWTWDVPSLQKLWNWPKWADHWQFSGVTVVQSGQPYTIFSGPIFGELTQRVNALGPIATSSNPNSAIDPTNIELASLSAGCAFPFANPTAGGLFAADGSTGTACTGNTGRNQFTGPMFSTFNLAVTKSFFPLGEGKVFSVRAEFFNLFNADNFHNPVSAYSLDGFTVNPDFGKIKSSGDPRQIQFAARFTW